MAFRTKSHTSCLLEEWGSSAAPEQQEAKWQAERRILKKIGNMLLKRSLVSTVAGG